MNVQEQRQGAVTVIKPEGPLLGTDAEQFKNRLLQVMKESLGRCVVDTSAVPFVDSRGLETLVETNDEMARSGHVLKLCGVTETVRQVLELTKLAPRFDYFEAVNSAVRSYL